MSTYYLSKFIPINDFELVNGILKLWRPIFSHLAMVVATTIVNKGKATDLGYFFEDSFTFSI